MNVDVQIFKARSTQFSFWIDVDDPLLRIIKYLKV